jgi:hypothetical protein
VRKKKKRKKKEELQVSAMFLSLLFMLSPPLEDAFFMLF